MQYATLHNQTPMLSESELAAFLRPPVRMRDRLARPLTGLATVATLVVAAVFGGMLDFSPEPHAAAQVVAVPSATPEATPVATPEATPIPEPLTPDNTVAFQAQNVSSPITWDVAFDTKAQDAALKNGAIHLAGTPKPGQAGYTVVFGHSSSLPWVKSDYGSIFAPIVNAKAGEQILLTYGNVTYTYEVTRTYEVKPTDLSVLRSSGAESGARFVTCTPIGTSLKRFIVEAKQLSPDPARNTPFTGTELNGILPGN